MLCYVWPSLLSLISEQEISVCFKAVRVCWVFVWCFYLLEVCFVNLLEERNQPELVKIQGASEWVIGADLLVKVSKFGGVSPTFFRGVSKRCSRSPDLLGKRNIDPVKPEVGKQGEDCCDSWKKWVWSSCIVVEHQPVWISVCVSAGIIDLGVSRNGAIWIRRGHPCSAFTWICV